MLLYKLIFICVIFKKLHGTLVIGETIKRPVKNEIPKQKFSIKDEASHRRVKRGGYWWVNDDNPSLVNNIVDLVFLVDVSKNDDQLKDGIAAFNYLISKLDIGNSITQTRVGFVSFASKARVEFRLGQFPSKQKIQRAIAEVETGIGMRNTAFAIATAIDKVFCDSKERRIKIMIVITRGTDKTSSDVDDKILKEAKRARRHGITIYAFGVGNDINARQLDLIAGSPSRVYATGKYSGLSKLFDVIISGSGKGGGEIRWEYKGPHKKFENDHNPADEEKPWKDHDHSEDSERRHDRKPKTNNDRSDEHEKDHHKKPWRDHDRSGEPEKDHHKKPWRDHDRSGEPEKDHHKKPWRDHDRSGEPEKDHHKKPWRDHDRSDKPEKDHNKKPKKDHDRSDDRDRCRKSKKDCNHSPDEVPKDLPLLLFWKSIDMAFVFDVSSSIQRDHCQKAKMSCIALIKKLQIGFGIGETRVAFISFTYTPHIKFNFGDYASKDGVIKAIDKVQQQSGNSNLALAIKAAIDRLFIHRRPQATNVIVIFTNRKHIPSKDDVDRIRQQLDRAKLRRITVYLLGIENNVVNIFHYEDFRRKIYRDKTKKPDHTDHGRKKPRPEDSVEQEGPEESDSSAAKSPEQPDLNPPPIEPTRLAVSTEPTIPTIPSDVTQPSAQKPPVLTEPFEEIPPIGESPTVPGDVAELPANTGSSTQLPAQSTDTRNRNFDVVFVVDESNNIQQNDFPKVLKACRDFVNKFMNAVGNTAQVGFVGYASKAHIEFNLGDYKSVSYINNAITKVAQRGGNGDLAKGISTAINNVFSKSKPNSHKIMIVIMGSPKSLEPKDKEEIENETKKAKQTGIAVYVMTVGKEINAKFLDIGSGSITKIYNINTVSRLNYVLDGYVYRDIRKFVRPRNRNIHIYLQETPTVEYQWHGKVQIPKYNVYTSSEQLTVIKYRWSVNTRVFRPFVGKVIDLVFVTDVSNDVSPIDLRKALRTYNSLVSQLEIGSNDLMSRVGFVSVSSTTKTEFYLGDHTSVNAVRKAINRVALRGGKKNMTIGIETALNEVFSKSRDGVTKAMFIFDGVNKIDQNFLYKINRETKRAREQGIVVFALGIDKEDDSTIIYEFKYVSPSKTVILNKPTHVIAKAPPVQNIPLKFDRAVDLVLVVDRSNYIKKSDFKSALSICNDIIDRIDFDADNTNVRVGLVSFGSIANVEFQLGQYKTADVIKQAINGISMKKGTGSIAGGMASAISRIFSRSYADVHKIMIIVTSRSRASTPNEEYILSQRVNSAKLLKIDVYAIAVAQDTNLKLLGLITKRIFDSTNYQEILDIVAGNKYRPAKKSKRLNTVKSNPAIRAAVRRKPVEARAINKRRRQ